MRLVLIILVTAVAAHLSAAIVNNSTASPTAEDSLTVAFYSLDSLGNPTTADSLFVVVNGPNGTVAFADSMAISDSRVVTTTVCSRTFYSFKDQVSNLDGGGTVGSYSMGLIAKNNSYSLLTATTMPFQIISRELSDQMQMIEDSVLVKGGAVDTNYTERGADSGSVAGWVWNTPQSNHTSAGTFGRNLDAQISGLIGSGAGLYSYTIQLYDTANSQVVPQAIVAVRNLAQSALIAVGTSDNDGQVHCNLDSGSFVVVAAAPGYIFTAYDTITVDGAGTDTVLCASFDPGAPVYSSFCRVWGYFFMADGSSEPNVMVSAHIPSGVTTYSSGIIIMPTAVTTSSDTSGYFFLDLLPSGSLGASGAEYEFTISRSDGTVLRQRLEVPDSTSWRLVW